MKERIVSLLLIICMLFSLSVQNMQFIWTVGNTPVSVSVEYEGSKISNIIIPQNEKRSLTAVCDPQKADHTYQWQVLADVQSGLWVNITGQSEEAVTLSYAVLSSVMDMSGSAYIRCAVKSGGETVYSEPVCATISFTPEVPAEQAPAKQTARRARAALFADNMPEPVDGEYTYITIHYLDAISKEPIFGSYSSQIETGTEFHQTILSPTWLGFAPYYNPDEYSTADPDSALAPASRIALSFDSVTEDITINVYYKAIPVTYGVKYFFQNINDDFYSERADLYYTDKAPTGTIISDTELEDHAGYPEGFTPLYHYPEAVAADGSTVFECYYDRNYYLLKFDMNGGYGTEPIYARYDTPFVVNQPTKHGYVFAGWDLRTEEHPDGDGTADALPGVIPAENQSYIAIWKTTSANVTIVYWKENADDDRYTYWGADTIQALSSSSVDGADHQELPGSLKTDDYEQFYYSHADSNVFVEGDGSSIVNVYYNRKTYTITFKDNHNDNECHLKEHTHTGDYYKLTCTENEHTHTGDCDLICSIPEHRHTDACCDKDEHMHRIECYGATSGYTQANNNHIGYSDTISQIENPKAGYVYKYRRSNNTIYNYFYDGHTWYYLGRGSGKIICGLTYEGEAALSRYSYRESIAGNSLTCGQAEHAHGDGSCTYTCGSEEHSHSASCYSCGKKPHVHTLESCYTLSCCGLEEHVHGDGCSISCGKKEHIHSEECIKCTHTHTINCYTSQTLTIATSRHEGFTDITNEVTSPVSGNAYKINTGRSTYHNYFYFNGQWYYLGEGRNAYSGIDVSVSNPYYSGGINSAAATINCIHTHDASCYICGSEEHTHADSCYSCGQAEHTHSEACIIPEHTHDNTCKDEHIIKLVTRKYGASLDDIWPVVSGDGDIVYDNGERWDPSETTLYDEVLIYIAKMPADDFTLSMDPSNNAPLVMNYYLEALPVDRNPNLHIYGGKKYNLGLSLTAQYSFITEKEDFFEIEGFTKGVSDPANVDRYSGDADFYYTRNSYSLDFYNADGELLHTDDVLYEEGLDAYVDDMAFPEYPTTYEPNAYTFEGWYTTPEHIPGTEYQIGELMPAGNKALYAKWVPVLHTVNTFQTYNDMLNYEKSVANGNPDDSLIIKTYEVPHGSVIGGMNEPSSPVEGGLEYTFGGWFYILNGLKTAFTPLDLPVVRDMNVFADWGSHTAQPYVIHYVLKTDPSVKVADDTTGFGYQGNTRTFIPKAGDPYNQLYSQYNTGYFPTLASHSITMQYEENKENPQYNTFTFEYVHAENIPYTVKYVNRITGEVLGSKTELTNKAIVTERFGVYEGFVPDAFYKRLVISVEVDENGNVISKPEDNVITFYYTPNETTAFYAVHHMLQKHGSTGDNYAIDGSGDYIENSVHTEGTGNIGDILSFIPQTFTGYDVITDPAILVNLGESNKEISMNGDAFQFDISKNGTELYIFYRLKEYPYVVKYLNYDGDDPIKEEKNGYEKYGATINETAPTIPGFTLISDPFKSIAIKAYDNDTGAEQNPNEIVFYYISTQYNVQYKVAGDKGGTLSNGLETVVSKEGTYTFEGSMPSVHEGFRFDGWYLDEACTVPVDADWVDENNGRITPQVSKLAPEPETNIFYAKFTELTGDLIITRSNAEDEGNGDQVFVYKVTNTADPSLTIYVSVAGNGSEIIHDLRYGTYAVEQVNNWSWRYGDGKQTVTHDKSETFIPFDGAGGVKQWLNGNSEVVINVKGGQQ